MDVGSDLTLQWVEEVGNVIHEEVICGLEDVACEEVAVEETIETSVQDNAPMTDAEILMVPQNNDIESIYVIPQDQGHDYLNIQVTEEVITDNWDRSCPEDGMEVPDAKISHENLLEYDDMEIPLPIDQDSYTNSRPYPCDFCSKRFRKKANLMNHMVTHQTERPHGCNLCGARYVRKSDLNNHLKIHAYAPTRETLEVALGDPLANVDIESPSLKARKKRAPANPAGRKRKAPAAKRNVSDPGKIDLSRWSNQFISNEQQVARWPVTDSTKPYVCQFCGVSFAREKALASHARIHGGDSPFECQSCNEIFWDVNMLHEHMRVKHGLGLMPAGIEVQEETVNEVNSFVNEERFGEYFCDTCGVPFHRLDLLKRHRKIHVKQEVDTMEASGQHHVCNTCGEWFEEALALLAHAELHARSPSRRCHSCGARCRDDAELAEHVREMHADTAPPNTCVLCGKTCKDKRSLLKHSWIHNNDKTFGCTKCGKRFHSKARLRRHMVSHRNKIVACDECGEEFPDGRALVSHRHSHNKELGGRTFPCRECGKTFGSRSSQQIHIRIHTGERPYGCRFCWKAFADGGTLRKHERIHTGEKPYGCAICPRAFNQRVVLREHVRAHHSGPDPKCHNSLTPYMCKVCSDTLSTSDELVAHIVAHCDENTAMRRQPQAGPRKYKRRRKIKNDASVGPPRLSDSYDNLLGVIETESDDNSKRKVNKRTYGKQQSRQTSVEEGYQNVLKSFESSLQNINSIVNNSKTPKNKTPKKRVKKETQKANSSPANAMQLDPVVSTSAAGRPKMIHTQKTRVPVEMGTDGVKKGQKTKTMVTKTPKVMPNEQHLQLAPPAITIPPITGRPTVTFTGERNRPRTKNVSYHVEGRQSFVSATFPKALSQVDLPLSTANEMHIADQPPQQEMPMLEMVNIKVEPGMQKHHMEMNLNQQQLEHNNGLTEPEACDMNNRLDLNLVQEKAPVAVKTTKRRRPVRWTPKRRPSTAVRRSREQKFLSPPSMHVEATEMENQHLIQDNMDHGCDLNVSHSEMNISTPDLNIESNNIGVRSSNITVQETTASDQPPHELFETPSSEGNHLDVGYETNIATEDVEQSIQESILPDLDKENHMEELNHGNVKLSVKVEAAHESMMDMHNLIGSVEESVPETIIPDTVEYTCEMCAAVFSTRGELLLHVPIHI